mmetsp:Transcript_4958/g.14699  ORF Transcript_4958/g.14699 Transcript_4958/m.14699 type:complete len:234 (+) Transcript_4958:609-1310(+)
MCLSRATPARTKPRRWHGTRYKAWPRVAEFCKVHCCRGAVAVDIGCGNGKLAPAATACGTVVLACDTSRHLLDIARCEHGSHAYEVMVADALRLPWRSDVADIALHVAVLHHLSTPARRAAAIAEALRVVRPGGVALFYAWARDQRRGRSGHTFDAPDVLVPFHLRDHGQQDPHGFEPAPAHAVRDAAKRTTIVQRYCHVYAERELAALVAPHALVDDVYYDEGNWAVACTRG